jgi:hypothetical protein
MQSSQGAARLNLTLETAQAMREDVRWVDRDRDGREIYLTGERWEHICDHHPEMAKCEAELRQTIRLGLRRQDKLSPQKYRYLLRISHLPGDNTHVEAVVLFRFAEGEEGDLTANNYIVTAYLKQLR